MSSIFFSVLATSRFWPAIGNFSQGSTEELFFLQFYFKQKWSVIGVFLRVIMSHHAVKKKQSETGIILAVATYVYLYHS